MHDALSDDEAALLRRIEAESIYRGLRTARTPARDRLQKNGLIFAAHAKTPDTASLGAGRGNYWKITPAGIAALKARALSKEQAHAP